MGILSWIVMGLIVGLLAKLLMPGGSRGTHYYYFVGDCRCLRRWVYRVMAGTWDSYGTSCKELIAGYWWRCHPVDIVSGYRGSARHWTNHLLHRVP